ncbi:MAG TPA: xanthine dehydrogenase family protein subunit M [Anaerolineales bacterium]|nr:xanthine dehydrogenase family protein subunit M [Anaerolineales bacterium]
MKPPPFEYFAPDSVDEALGAIQRGGPDAKFLAGGQSLVPAMNFRIAQPTLLVDLNRIRDLDFIRSADDGLRFGAMTRQHSLETDPQVAKQAPLLAEAVPFIAHPQIRNRGTFGGSLVHADPASELPVVALALQARMRLAAGGGERWISAEDFFQGMFTTALAPDEMLVEIALPPWPADAGGAFVEFSRRSGDYALMGVAAVLRVDGDRACTEARLVFLNAGDGPVAAPEAAAMLVGRPVDEMSAGDAADHAAEKEIDPMGNLHATPAFQRHLARVLVRRAILTAAARASDRHGSNGRRDD